MKPAGLPALAARGSRRRWRCSRSAPLEHGPVTGGMSAGRGSDSVSRMHRGRLAPAASAPAVLAALSLAACGGGDDAPDNGSFDNASCGNNLNFSGELVDWDNDTTPCGINEALLQVQGDGPQDTTSETGRFESICITRDPTVILDVTPPTGNSTCTTPPSAYAVPGIAVANREVILANATFSARSFTTARRDAFFAQAGFSYAPALAQVFVHVHGTPRAVSISASHAPAQAIVSTTWAAGDTGHDVFFPNVDASAGSTMLSVAGGALGTGKIPLVGGKFTYVTVYAR